MSKKETPKYPRGSFIWVGNDKDIYRIDRVWYRLDNNTWYYAIICLTNSDNSISNVEEEIIDMCAKPIHSGAASVLFDLDI